jgi:hypothetical protein
LQIERRKEKRLECRLKVGVFLSQEKSGEPLTPQVQGLLVSLSRQGADVALEEIMQDRTHLALASLGSNRVLLNLVLPAGDGENTLTVAGKPVWFDKRTDTGVPPFRIGLRFVEDLTSRQYQRINRLI